MLSLVVVLLVAHEAARVDASAAVYLLLDDRNVIQSRGVELALGQVEKAPQNPLLTEQQPWELQFNNMQPSVWFDAQDSKFKLWYNMFSTCSPPTARSCGAVSYTHLTLPTKA